MQANSAHSPVKHILLLGPPASGKGTQARQLSEELGLPCLGTGKLLREEIDQGSEIGKEASSYMEKGHYVPDEIIMKMVQQWMDKNANGWILDGFPRTLPQAKALQEMQAPELVIALDVPKEVLEARITKRRECDNCGATVAVEDESQVTCPVCNTDNLTARADDALDSFRVRYSSYAELTLPLFDYYTEQGIVQHVDGTQLPDAVYQEVTQVIKNA